MTRTSDNQSRLEKALVDPARVFDSPAAVVEDGDLSNEEKIKVLRRWEYDAREIDVANEEGFPPGGRQGALMDKVIEALHALGAGPRQGTPAGTRHG